MAGEELQLLRDFINVASADQIREISQNGPNALTKIDAVLNNPERAQQLAKNIATFLLERHGLAPTQEEILLALREIREGIHYVRKTYGTTPLNFYLARAVTLPNGEKVEVPAYLQETRTIAIPFEFLQHAGVIQSSHVVSSYRQKPGHYFPGSYFYRLVAIEEAAHCNQDFEGRFHLPPGQLASTSDLDFEKEIDQYFARAFDDLGIPVLTTPEDNIQVSYGNIYTVVKDADQLNKVGQTHI